MITKIMMKSFLVNLSLTILKLLGSFLSNSKTLLADGIHCLSDMFTDIIGLVGSKLSDKKPDEKHPFGHGKIEYLTSILISFFIISLSISIIKNAFVGNLTQPNIIALIIIIITLIIKFFLSSYLIRRGKELNSNILVTNGTESRYDTYSSLIGLIFVILSLFGSENKIFLYSDRIGSIIMSIFTLKVGLHLLFQNISSVLGEVEIDEELNNNIKNILIDIKEIQKIRRITIIKYGSYYMVTIDIFMNASSTLSEIYKVEKRIKKELKEAPLKIRYVTVNIKPKQKSR